MLLVKIIVLWGAVEILSISTKGPRRPRASTEILEAKDSLEDVSSDIHDILFAKKFGASVTQ